MIHGACLGGKVERCVGESKLGSDNTDEWECGKKPWTRGKEWYIEK